jgi:hypothetical protein
MTGYSLGDANFVVVGPERVQSKLKAARAAMRLHLNIGPEERPNRPFHLRLTLSDAKAAADHGHPDN